MKMGIFVILMLSVSIFVVAGCAEMPPETEDLSDLTISFSDYGFPLIINGNGSISSYSIGFSGDYNHTVYSIKTGYISQDELLALVEVFKENGFFSMKEQYDCGDCAYVVAPPSFSISFKQGDFEKNVTDVGRYAPEGFYTLVAELEEIRDSLTSAEISPQDACSTLNEISVSK